MTSQIASAARRLLFLALVISLGGVRSTAAGDAIPTPDAALQSVATVFEGCLLDFDSGILKLDHTLTKAGQGTPDSDAPLTFRLIDAAQSIQGGKAVPLATLANLPADTQVRVWAVKAGDQYVAVQVEIQPPSIPTGVVADEVCTDGCEDNQQGGSNSRNGKSKVGNALSTAAVGGGAALDSLGVPSLQGSEVERAPGSASNARRVANVEARGGNGVSGNVADAVSFELQRDNVVGGRNMALPVMEERELQSGRGFGEMDQNLGLRSGFAEVSEQPRDSEGQTREIAIQPRGTVGQPRLITGQPRDNQAEPSETGSLPRRIIGQAPGVAVRARQGAGQARTSIGQTGETAQAAGTQLISRTLQGVTNTPSQGMRARAEVGLELVGLATEVQVGPSNSKLPAVAAEVSLRGPVHEAFARPLALRELDGSESPTAPPSPIEEAKLVVAEGMEFVNGYWCLEPLTDEFMWVPGMLRRAPEGMKWQAGKWVRSAGKFVRLPGFWNKVGQVKQVPSIALNEVLVPARKIRTLAGVIDVPAYVDHGLEQRGKLFAPVRYVASQGEKLEGLSAPPCVAIAVENLFYHLFETTDGEYCFGDYYGELAQAADLKPWHAAIDNKKSLISQYARAYKARGVNLVERLQQWTALFNEHPELCPPASLAGARQLLASGKNLAAVRAASLCELAVAKLDAATANLPQTADLTQKVDRAGNLIRNGDPGSGSHLTDTLNNKLQPVSGQLTGLDGVGSLGGLSLDSAVGAGIGAGVGNLGGLNLGGVTSGLGAGVGAGVGGSLGGAVGGVTGGLGAGVGGAVGGVTGGLGIGVGVGAP